MHLYYCIDGWMDGWIFIKLTLDVGVWHERKQTDDFKTSKDTFECCHVSYTVLHTELVTVTCLLSCLKSYSLPPRPNLGINYRIVCIVFFPAHYAISLCSKQCIMHSQSGHYAQSHPIYAFFCVKYFCKNVTGCTKEKRVVFVRKSITNILLCGRRWLRNLCMLQFSYIRILVTCEICTTIGI